MRLTMQVSGKCEGIREQGGEMRALGIQPCSSSVCAREGRGGAQMCRASGLTQNEHRMRNRAKPANTHKCSQPKADQAHITHQIITLHKTHHFCTCLHSTPLYNVRSMKTSTNTGAHRQPATPDTHMAAFPLEISSMKCRRVWPAPSLSE